jgi:hypothetical protein
MRAPVNFMGYFLGFLMGCFGGVFLASPALSLLKNTSDSPGVGLWEYLRCEEVELWQRLTVVLP